MSIAAVPLRCAACGREGREGNWRGDTCGDWLPKPYLALTPTEQVAGIVAALTGHPLPASHPASVARERCLGVLDMPKRPIEMGYVHRLVLAPP